MSKKLRAAQFATTMLLILSAFFPWRVDIITNTTVNGWSTLISEPLKFLVVILLIIGSLSYIFLRPKRYGFFTITLGLATLYLLVSDMSRTLRLSQQNFSQLYQSGFLVSVILVGIIILLSAIQLIQNHKND
ncbi:MAG: hypothetical protein LBV67_09685 [Streptococcaceae bacterium]|nr:hypothetical protein [Streptococcaceae bacterium]